MGEQGNEEHFILRLPPKVAQRVTKVLREDPTQNPGDLDMDLNIGEEGKIGKFCIGQDKFNCTVMNLPCVVESFKTYDDVNLVKSADVGQMILVTDRGEPMPAGAELDAVVEAVDGITPPMKNARKRHFRKEQEVDPQDMEAVEADLVQILAGGTARNVEIETVEEEYIILPNGKGEWRPVD